ncbi:MAG: hypothetical protein CVU30_04395 [Betaproteobacteria bacterium HGW-Betaproteobacteria-3]|nr:MAG: hypothetical protein CVU30_04395 [Betaproteobacteria bacterium HGW-Betaproteobacteria-3]
MGPEKSHGYGSSGRRAGPPQARPAPSGGSTIHEVTSVRAMVVRPLFANAPACPRRRPDGCGVGAGR